MTELGITDLDMERAEISLDARSAANARSCSISTAPSSISRRRRSRSGCRPGLRQTLARLDALTGGAVALVSGRSLNDIDLIFSPLQLAAIGGHGAELRAMAGGATVQRARPLARGAASASSPASANSVPASSPKTKAIRSLCIIGSRRRKATRVRAAVDKICAAERPGTIEILPGKFVVEIKAARHQQGRCGLRTDEPSAVRRPQSDFYRRRYDR